MGQVVVLLLHPRSTIHFMHYVAFYRQLTTIPRDGWIQPNHIESQQLNDMFIGSISATPSATYDTTCINLYQQTLPKMDHDDVKSLYLNSINLVMTKISKRLISLSTSSLPRSCFSSRPPTLSNS